MSRVDGWPQFSASAYDENPELRDKEAFLAFLDETERRFVNRTSPGDWLRSPGDWLGIVEYYSTEMRRVVGHTAAELRSRGTPGFRSKLDAVDCLLAARISLAPVRATGSVFFFRGTTLDPAERPVYVSYRRRTDDGLACGELFSPEVGRQRAALTRDNAKFWQSLKALTDMVDLNAYSGSDRLVEALQLDVGPILFAKPNFTHDTNHTIDV